MVSNVVRAQERVILFACPISPVESRTLIGPVEWGFERCSKKAVTNERYPRTRPCRLLVSSALQGFEASGYFPPALATHRL